MNKKSHVMAHMMTLRIFGIAKSCAFGQIMKKCLIDSILLVESN